MVILKTLGKVFDITNIVDKNIKLNHTLTGLFDSGELGYSIR